MKKLTRTLPIALVIMFLIASFAIAGLPNSQMGDAFEPDAFELDEIQTYTYDGEFDPMVFYNWKVIRQSECPQGTTCFMVANPDKDSEVPFVELLMVHHGDNEWTLIAYRYLKGDVKYGFILERYKSHYKQVRPRLLDKSGGI